MMITKFCEKRIILIVKELHSNLHIYSCGSKILVGDKINQLG